MQAPRRSAPVWGARLGAHAPYRRGQRRGLPADRLVRDRPGAARELTTRVRQAAAAGTLQPPVVLVLEGQAKQGVEEGVADGVEVVHAAGEGDDTLAALAAASGQPVVLVSADRGLAAPAAAQRRGGRRPDLAARPAAAPPSSLSPERARQDAAAQASPRLRRARPERSATRARLVDVVVSGFAVDHLAHRARGSALRRDRGAPRRPGAEGRLTAGEQAARRSHRLPATSTNTATRPYGSSRGGLTNSTPAARIRSWAASKSSTRRKKPTRPAVWFPTAEGLSSPRRRGEQEACLRTGWPRHDPALRTPIVRQRRPVLHQLEAERADEELDGTVVLVDDDRGEVDPHGRSVRTRPPRPVRRGRYGEASMSVSTEQGVRHVATAVTPVGSSSTRSTSAGASSAAPRSRSTTSSRRCSGRSAAP